MDNAYFDALMESLADAAAFACGDTSRAKVVEVDAAIYETSGVVQDKIPPGKY